MRMSQDGFSAADLLNEGAPELLSDIIAVYGEERRARAIAKAIIARRESKPMARTGDLVDAVCWFWRAAFRQGASGDANISGFADLFE